MPKYNKIKWVVVAPFGQRLNYCLFLSTVSGSIDFQLYLSFLSVQTRNIINTTKDDYTPF